MRPLSPVYLVGAVAVVFATGCSDCLTGGSLVEVNQGDADVWQSGDDIGDIDGDGDADILGDGDGDGENCPSQLQCGQNCCTSSEELCIGGVCVLPGDPCEHNLQCPDGEFCDTVLGHCLPGEAGECLYIPDDDAFDPVVLIAWEGDENTPLSEYNQVMMTPAVVDITGDGIPEIVFSTFRGSTYQSDGILRAVNGRTFAPIFDLTEVERRVAPGASLAIGDIDGDGKNEIVAVQSNGQGLIAFDDFETGWAVKWTTEAFNMNYDGAYLVDLDGNGSVEVVAANRVYDGATGQLLCVNSDVTAQHQHSIVADLNGDGSLEIIAARGAFRFVRDPDGNVFCPTLFTYADGISGFPAVADFGTFNGEDHQFGVFNGRPEIAVVSLSATDTVRLYNGQTGEVIWSVALPLENHPHFTTEQCENRSGGGPPTIADFNGDGMPNVATAGACYYVVYDEQGELMWKMATQDLSSRITGSSVFDFQGNGRAEVVYADECFLRVYDGAGNGDGTTDVLFEVANTTGTLRELPVIVDVDGDFHADIVLIGNNYSSGITTGCRARWPGFDDLGGPSRGIRVIRDRENRWVSTRPVWNQHAYSVVNVCDGIDNSLCPGTTNRPGAIPRNRLNNPTHPGLNNYRQNVQGEGLFQAPDLVITNIDASCSGDGLLYEVTVANQGSRSVIEGVNVALFATVDDQEVLVTVLQTTQMLTPGGSETLTYNWEDHPYPLGDDLPAQITARANDDGEGNRQFRECNEDNNSTTAQTYCICTSDTQCRTGHYCAEGICIPVPG